MKRTSVGSTVGLGAVDSSLSFGELGGCNHFHRLLKLEVGHVPGFYEVSRVPDLGKRVERVSETVGFGFVFFSRHRYPHPNFRIFQEAVSSKLAGQTTFLIPSVFPKVRLTLVIFSIFRTDFNRSSISRNVAILRCWTTCWRATALIAGRTAARLSIIFVKVRVERATRREGERERFWDTTGGRRALDGIAIFCVGFLTVSVDQDFPTFPAQTEMRENASLEDSRTRSVA